MPTKNPVLSREGESGATAHNHLLDGGQQMWRGLGAEQKEARKDSALSRL